MYMCAVPIYVGKCHKIFSQFSEDSIKDSNILRAFVIAKFIGDLIHLQW